MPRDTTLSVTVARGGLDPAWDNFLQAQPDGCYQQSSMWAELSAAEGWGCLRVVARAGTAVVGGAQALLRALPVGGTVGYVPKGPVIASRDPTLQTWILDQLDRAARDARVRFLKLQPPFGADGVAQVLQRRGARPSLLEVAPLATARVDLTADPRAILTRMSHGRRRAIKRAERKWAVVRAGTQADIPACFRLARMHGMKRGYHPGSEDHFYRLWSLFEPGGNLRLLIAERDDVPLAALFLIVFGDVATTLYMVDSGYRSELNLQTLLLWYAILCAKDCDCAWLDFGGIHQEVARALLHDQPLPDSPPGRQAWYKMSFGSELIVRPGVFDQSYLWPRRLTVRIVPALVKLRPLMRFLLGSAATRAIRIRDKRATRLREEQ